jgi:hypothetical protein
MIQFCGQKVCQGLQSVRDFQHNTGIVFCCNGIPTIGLKNVKNGRTNGMHEEGAGCQSTATNEGNIEHARGMVLLDRQVTIDEKANRMHFSHGSAYEITHNRLEFREVCARCVPKLLNNIS